MRNPQGLAIYWMKLDCSGEGDGVESGAIASMVIIAPPPNRGKTGDLVQYNSRIAVPHFKMNAFDALPARTFDEIVDQHSADSATVPVRFHCNEEQLGFLSDGAG